MKNRFSTVVCSLLIALPVSTAFAGQKFKFTVRQPAVFVNMSRNQAWNAANDTANAMGVRFHDIRQGRGRLLGTDYEVTIEANSKAEAYQAAEDFRTRIRWKGF